MQNKWNTSQRNGGTVALGFQSEEIRGGYLSAEGNKGYTYTDEMICCIPPTTNILQGIQETAHSSIECESTLPFTSPTQLMLFFQLHYKIPSD